MRDFSGVEKSRWKLWLVRAINITHSLQHHISLRLRESKTTNYTKPASSFQNLMERSTFASEKARKKTALVIIPPETIWPSIQQIRQQHDQKAAAVWMPHIKLLFPFLEEDAFKVLIHLIIYYSCWFGLFGQCLLIIAAQNSLATLQSVIATIQPFTSNHLHIF